MEFGRACEDLSWNHRPSTPDRSETNGIAERAIRRVKEGTSAVFATVRTWWNAIAICETSKTSWPTGRRHMKDDFWEPFKGPIIPFGAMVEYHPISPKDQARIHQFGKSVLPGIFLGYELIAAWNLETRFSDSRSGRYGKVGSIRNLSSKNQRKGIIDQTKRWWIYIPNCADDTAKSSGRDYEFRVPTLRRRPTVRSEDLSREIQGESGDSQRAEPTDDAEARLLVDPRWLHLSSSHWTSSSNSTSRWKKHHLFQCY